MLSSKLLAHIAKISNNALNIILAFNIRDTDEFIDMLVEMHDFGTHIVYAVNNITHNRHGPAIIGTNGIKMWCIAGKLHSTQHPAIEHPDGKKEWYKNGLLHKDKNPLNGPAIEYPDGSGEYYQNGILQGYGKLNGKWSYDRKTYSSGLIVFPNGTKNWYRKGQLHRGGNEDFQNIIGNEDLRNVVGNEDLRNVVGNEDLRNVVGNEYFRNPGPAVERLNGRKEWWQNGKLHRINGPAIEHGDKKEWYIYGIHINGYP